jgi:hypothetical protein
MDAKTRDLALLAALSFICTGVAWIWGYVILGSVLFALGNRRYRPSREALALTCTRPPLARPLAR